MFCNEATHNALICLGFEYTHHEEDIEDHGDPENGPKIYFTPAYDQYVGALGTFYISGRDGKMHWEERDFEFERWLESQGMEMIRKD